MFRDLVTATGAGSLVAPDPSSAIGACGSMVGDAALMASVSGPMAKDTALQPVLEV